MVVSDVRYESNAGYPEMHCVVDGTPTIISSEQIKRTLLGAGMVYLGPTWEALVPAIDLPADETVGRGPITLHGHTRDPQVLDAVRRFISLVDSDSL